MSIEKREKNDKPLSSDPMINGLLNGHATTNGESEGPKHIYNEIIHLADDSTGAAPPRSDEPPPPPFKMPHAPPHVYSCFVVNRTAQAIECDLHYNGRPDEAEFNEDVHVTIPPKEEKYFPRKIFQPDIPKSYCRWVKIITHIRIKKHDGTILEVDYPFDNVHAPVRNWEFHVREFGDILSKPPTRPANILKYENLDEYER